VVEALVQRLGAVEQDVFAVPLRKDVHVGEVAGFGAVEQGEELACGQFLGSEGRPEEAGGAGLLGCGVQGEVDEQVLGAVYDQSAELCVVVDARDAPAAVAGGVFQLVADCGDTGGVAGEQVQVLGGAVGQVLREQGGPSGE